MRMEMVSMLSGFALLACSLPAAAQVSPAAPAAPLMLEERLPASATNIPNVPKRTETGDASLPSDTPNARANELQQLRDALKQKDGLAQLKNLMAEKQACGHIQVFDAPAVDSKMLQKIPSGFNSNMPKMEGLPPCERDVPPLAAMLRKLPQLNPDKPFVVIPKPSLFVPKP
jgi:hypothetical protein